MDTLQEAADGHGGVGAGGTEEGEEFDVVGVGFGPSNLALAIAVREHNDRNGSRPLRAAFLERQPQFGWHRGMLIDDARMQVSFLKDLATMRDPTSDFTFVSYLHDRGRLVDFINLKNFFPTRTEFHDYLKWSARRVDDLVRYNREVTCVAPVSDEAGNAVSFDVVSRCESAGFGTETLRARNIVIATGLTPWVPPGVALSGRVWHSSQLLINIGSLWDSPPRSVAVVGSGQSAAEVSAHLHRCFPDAEVHCVMQRYGYSASDNTPFANRVFDPVAVEDFYSASPEVRERIIGYHANTNYSVVDEDLITDLYQRAYQESVTGRTRLSMWPLRHLRGVVERPGGGPALQLTHLPTETAESLEVDVLVLATGYQQMDPRSLLQRFDHECLRDSSGRLQIARSHRVMTTDVVQGGIYVQGGTEHTHGLSSSLLSNAAVRAAEVLDSVVSQVPAEKVQV